MTQQTSRMSLVPIAVVAASLTLALTFVLVGCNRQNRHPDVKSAVDTAMTRNDLGVVKVSQDREKGVLTLTGDVDTPDQKAQAEKVAAQTAPGYAISNEIGVRSPSRVFIDAVPVFATLLGWQS